MSRTCALRGKQRMYRGMSQNLRTGRQIVSRVNKGVLCGRIVYHYSIAAPLPDLCAGPLMA
jgi:hypothetical protein